MDWRITVDREICVGSGTCVVVAAGRFALDDDDRSNPVTSEIKTDEQVREAAQMCPTGAISLRDLATGKPVWPPA
jgi:ferredoxin